MQCERRACLCAGSVPGPGGRTAFAQILCIMESFDAGAEPLDPLGQGDAASSSLFSQLNCLSLSEMKVQMPEDNLRKFKNNAGLCAGLAHLAAAA